MTMRKKTAKALRKVVAAMFAQHPDADASKEGNYYRKVKKAYLATPRKFRNALKNVRA